MNRTNIAASLATAMAIGLFSSEACAWFFFIPGELIAKVGDAITGSEGENCVASTAKVGDVITSPTGNTAMVKSLSGESSRCRNPSYPIRALLQFNYSFGSQVGIDLPDTFKPKDLTSIQRFNGALLNAIDQPRTIGVYVSARPKKPGDSGAALARSVSDNLLSAIEKGDLTLPEEVTINGLHAYRFQVVGNNKGIFGRSFTYLVTILEGPTEYIVVNANCLTADFQQYKDELSGYASKVGGFERSLKPTETNTADSSPAATSANGSVPSASPAASNQDSVRGQEDASKPSQEKAPVASSAAPTSPGSIEDRLRTLERLLKEGLITQTDYEEKKKELLKQL